ncbi:MAG: pyruvate kinase, partial [Nitrospira sp.]|nr:pyruvate kinase [Nitrospira sp.]
EKLESLDIIAEILAVADSIMVARGDLGIEVPITQVPHIQKELISKANQASKPVVTATQMLRSMVENPRPSRAEVSDIANAVLDGSDALMLSEESAVGAYPVEAVKVLAETAEVAEDRLFARRPFVSLCPTDRVSASESIAHAASLVAHQAKATAIICCTRTGQTARLVAKYRPAHADLVPAIRAALAGKTFLSLSLGQGATPPQQDGDGGQSNRHRRVQTPRSPESMVRNCQFISATDDHRARWHQRTALAYGA